VDGLTRKVVVITDGDRIATKVVEKVAKNVGGRAISLSGGNPTEVSGTEIAEAVKSTPYDPVLVMFDDCGARGKGRGEIALEELAKDPEIEILGAVAVASNTAHVEGVTSDVSVTREGEIIDASVDKDGNRKGGHVIEGDTVDILNRLNISVVVGVGDLGKMQDADLVTEGARITTLAVQEVLKRSHYLH
jgi:stage V sporulation protein AE